jgi:hypothetical protein
VTSGNETYGAGRYLDLEAESDGTYVIDFNLAYHPYCVYADDFSCPLTPAENRLPIRIEAGERLADEDAATGADYIVVGRPITAAADPRSAAQAIVDSLR